MSNSHELAAAPETVHWGLFDAAIPPRLTVESGDEVTVHTVSGPGGIIPADGYTVLPEHRAVVEALSPPPATGGHILTGPVAVSGAKAGEVLQVDILDIQLRQDWGWNIIKPLAGAIPEDFPEYRLMHIGLDRERHVGRLPWGKELPLAPFFGVMGVAPPVSWGTLSTVQPRAFGGNLDNKELVTGTTLYLPVFNDGALFSAGDGHALQGDGEVCVTAIETALTGTFRLTRRQDMRLAFPRAETPTHYITMFTDPDLDQAANNALRDMIRLITERTKLSREDAYTLCSLAADLRVTQIVNQNKGVHVMLEKSVLEP